MAAECCGNGICEAGEYSSCEDCGTFELDTPIPHPSVSYACPQYRFDIESKGEDIAITGLTVYPFDASGKVDTTMSVWTAPGSYKDNAWGPAAWTRVAASVPVSCPSETFSWLARVTFSPRRTLCPDGFSKHLSPRAFCSPPPTHTAQTATLLSFDTDVFMSAFSRQAFYVQNDK